MSEQDKYDRDAAKLLPCSCKDSMYYTRGKHLGSCFAVKRPAVAAALRAQGLEIERLQLQLERFKQLDAIEIGQLQTSLAHINDDCLRAEQERDKLKARLAATRSINEQLIAGNDKLEAQLAEVTKTAQSYVWGVEVKP